MYRYGQGYVRFLLLYRMANVNVKRLNPDNLPRNIDGGLWIEAKGTNQNKISELHAKDENLVF